MKKITFLLVPFILLGCQSDDNVNLPTAADCAAVSCFAGLAFISFEVLDAATNENLFLTGRFNKDDVRVSNTNNETLVPEIGDVFDKESVLMVTDMWQTGTSTYTITFGDSISFDFDITLSITEGSDCCSGVLQLSRMEIEGIPHQIDPELPLAAIFVN